MGVFTSKLPELDSSLVAADCLVDPPKDSGMTGEKLPGDGVL